MNPQNPWYLRLLNMGPGSAGLGENFNMAKVDAADIRHPITTIDSPDRLAQPSPATTHGFYAGAAGSIVGLLGYYAIAAYHRNKMYRLRKRLADLNKDKKIAILAEAEVQKLLSLAHNNTHLMKRKNIAELRTFMQVLRSDKVSEMQLAEFLSDSPQFLQLAIADDDLREKITDYRAVAILKDAASHQEEINKILRTVTTAPSADDQSPEAAGARQLAEQLVDYADLKRTQRNLLMPSAMGFPLIWDVRYFLGVGSGLLWGGLLGSILLPGFGTAIGAIVGAGIHLAVGELYAKFAVKIRSAFKDTRVIKALDENWERDRKWYNEAKSDVPFMVRWFLGLATGAAMGGAMGTFAPGIGNIIGAFIGATVMGTAAVISPAAFRAVRGIARKFSGRDASEPQARSVKKERRWYRPSQMDVPWYLRLFAASGAGGALGATIGAYIGTIGGTILLPGVGTVAGAALCAAAGSAIGGAIGAAVTLLSPPVLALRNYIAEKMRSLRAQPYEQLNANHKPYKAGGLDILWEGRVMPGVLAGLTIGMMLGTVAFPGIGSAFGAMVGAIGGATISLAYPLLSAIHRRIKNAIVSNNDEKKQQDNVARLDRVSKTATFSLGVSATGAVIGAAIGSAIPVLGTAIGAAIGGALFTGAGLGIRKIKHHFQRKSGVNPYAPRPKLELPSYVRVFAGAMSGKLLGALIGGGVGFLMGGPLGLMIGSGIGAAWAAVAGSAAAFATSDPDMITPPGDAELQPIKQANGEDSDNDDDLSSSSDSTLSSSPKSEPAEPPALPSESSSSESEQAKRTVPSETLLFGEHRNLAEFLRQKPANGPEPTESSAASRPGFSSESE